MQLMVKTRNQKDMPKDAQRIVDKLFGQFLQVAYEIGTGVLAAGDGTEIKMIMNEMRHLLPDAY